MRNIWLMVNGMKIRVRDKYSIFISLIVIICGLLGALTWATVGRFILPETMWLVCFIGYPAFFIGVFGGAFYLFSHEF